MFSMFILKRYDLKLCCYQKFSFVFFFFTTDILKFDLKTAINHTSMQTKDVFRDDMLQETKYVLFIYVQYFSLC